ncbi:hypothetical protein Tco_0922234 [Tanacetum coccineum]|uniref:Reverse transcriptase domain-containing protein n=1 Tax=Tanacetum coccineum TaxID=301880 RepID=A0ABQ5CXJ1_9ASTR
MALDKGKFKPPPPMTTPVKKRNASKFCEFHGEVGHTTDECMHLKRQIEEILKAGKLLHLIKELKQNNGKDQANVAKKGEAAGKDKPLAILMVQVGRKIAKQRITQTFSPETTISFPPLGEEDGTKVPMVIEAEVGGHLVHRILKKLQDFLTMAILVGEDEKRNSESYTEYLYSRCSKFKVPLDVPTWPRFLNQRSRLKVKDSDDRKATDYESNQEGNKRTGCIHVILTQPNQFAAAITIITDPCPTRVPLWPLTDYARNTGKP